MRHKIICLALCLFFTGLVAAEAALKVEVPAKYYLVLLGYCEQYDVPIYYMSRLISWESGFDPTKTYKNTNGTVDKGIAMFNSVCMIDLARWHNNGVLFDPFDWHISLRIAVQHVKFLHDRTGSWFGAIAAYNCGEQRYKDWRAGKKSLPIYTQRELEFVFN